MANNPSVNWLSAFNAKSKPKVRMTSAHFAQCQANGLKQIHGPRLTRLAEQLRSEAQWTKANENKPLKRWVSKKS